MNALLIRNSDRTAVDGYYGSLNGKRLQSRKSVFLDKSTDILTLGSISICISSSARQQDEATVAGMRWILSEHQASAREDNRLLQNANARGEPKPFDQNLSEATDQEEAAREVPRTGRPRSQSTKHFFAQNVGSYL